MTIFRPSATTVGTAAAVMLAATAMAAPAHAASPPPGPVLACQSGICLLNPSGLDSDGDGFSDADEVAAGTDPQDVGSHPQILQILYGYLDLGIRPEGFGLREVIVLPQTAPDGSALVGGAFDFGPQRKDAMTRLGLTNSMLGGIAAQNGLRAVIDMAGTDTGGHPPVRVGGIDASLISTIGPDGRVMSMSRPVTEKTKDGGQVTYFHNEKIDSGIYLGPVKTDKDGTSHQGALSWHETRNSDGGKTETWTTGNTTKNPDGSSTNTTHSTTLTTDKEGKVVSSTQTSTQTTVDKDGNKTEVSVTKSTDKDGNTTTTTSTKTTDKDGNVVGAPTTTCTGDACERDSGELDPVPAFVPGSTITATPELTRRLEVHQGSDTNQGETPVEIGPDDQPEPPQYSPHHSGVIYIDPSNDAVWFTPTATMPDPDKVGGNITVVQGFVPPASVCLPTSALPCPS